MRAPSATAPTPDARRLAVCFTNACARIVDPALAQLDPKPPAEVADRSALARSRRSLERALERTITDAALVAWKDPAPVNVWATERS